MRIPFRESSRVVVADDQYTAELTEIREIETKFGMSLLWMFQIKDDRDYEGVTVSGFCPADITRDNKTMLWAKALGFQDEQVVEGEDIDLEQLYGCRGRIDVKLNGEWSNVVDVRPMERVYHQPPPARPVAGQRPAPAQAPAAAQRPAVRPSQPAGVAPAQGTPAQRPAARPAAPAARPAPATRPLRETPAPSDAVPFVDPDAVDPETGVADGQDF